MSACPRRLAWWSAVDPSDSVHLVSSLALTSAPPTSTRSRTNPRLPRPWTAPRSGVVPRPSLAFASIEVLANRYRATSRSGEPIILQRNGDVHMSCRTFLFPGASSGSALPTSTSSRTMSSPTSWSTAVLSGRCVQRGTSSTCSSAPSVSRKSRAISMLPSLTAASRGVSSCGPSLAANGSAPPRRSTFAISLFSIIVARCSILLPSRSVSSGFAPCRRSASAARALPDRTARCRGEWPRIEYAMYR